MQLALARVLLLQIFLSCCGFAVTVHAEEYDQFKLDLMLAKRGDSGAQFSVAGAYEEGRGVRKDLGKAFEWYNIAAKTKHKGAQFKLGEFYENGWGVKADKAKAQFWYQKAERNGSRMAKEHLKKLEISKQAEASSKAKKETERKRYLANEKAKKERQLAAAKAKREKDIRQAKAREAARKKKSVAAKSVTVVTPSVNAKKKKVSAQDRATAIARYRNTLLKNKWHSKVVAAEVLPSLSNSCLQTSETELVCFSHEQQTVIGNSQVTFTSKSVINNFKYNGDFTVSYYFNVLNVGAALAPGRASDPLGLRVEKGWQEPQQSMKCNIINARKLKCSRNGQTLYFQA